MEHQAYAEPRSTKSSEAEWNYHANSRQSCATAPPPPAAPAAAEEPLQQEAARSGSMRPALREWKAVVGAEKTAGRGGRARRRQRKIAGAGRGRRRGSADAIAMALLCRSNGGSMELGFTEAASHLR
jgi:hypothetical protein